MRPIGIDLFSGVGGLSLGFEQAGFDVVAAVEYDTIHASAHAFNFPNCTTIAQSVVGLSGAEIRTRAKIGNKKVDVVFGGAPCQGFSLIGQRILADPRNALVREFVRIVHELGSDYFVFENVKGLTQGPQKAFLDELIEEFAAVGYDVRLPWKVLNAAAYGAPQSRERLILIGARRGLEIPSYPEPQFDPPKKRGNRTKLAPAPTCEEALGDLPDAENFEQLNESDSVRWSRWKTPSTYGLEMRAADPSLWHLSYPRTWDPNILTASTRTDHSVISRRRFSETKSGDVEPISRFFKLPPDGVANTLRAGSDSARGAFTSPRPIHYKFPRCITVREMARLHGFPDWFRFHTTKWHGARQIGNAVPPPLARAIAIEIIRSAGFQPKRPTRSIKLGDPKLLEMGMAEASAYWGVAVPIGNRNRKSGIRKRTQAETEGSYQSTRSTT